MVSLYSDFKDWFNHPSYFISQQSPFKDNWDFIVMVTACWNVFMLPLSLSFEVRSDVTDEIDSIVDVCFIIDMIIVFRTTYIDDDGLEVFEAGMIASNYIRGRFWIDFLSTVPFDKVALVLVDELSAR